MRELLLTQGEFLLRMLLGALCGAAIGYERRSRMKEAGVRTHLIVALGSTMMMLVSKYGFFDVVKLEGITLDASRIAANIITGISFLGAGVIFVRGVTVSGLTTAAGIWATSGVGLAVGAGMYIVGVAAAGMILLLQVLLHRHLRFLDPPPCETITLTLDGAHSGMEQLWATLAQEQIQVLGVKSERCEGDTVRLTLTVRPTRPRPVPETFTLLQENPHVKTVEL